jgi:type II secretory pathway pseudopilin PulG
MKHSLQIGRDISKQGFTILELVIATSMFMIVSAAIFSLLENTQFRVIGEQDIVPVLQESRAAMDLLVRDIHRAGFPSPFEFPTTPDDPTTLQPANLQNVFSIGFVGLPSRTCTVSSTCSLPNGFDLLMESLPDSLNNQPDQPIQWIEYQLVRPEGATTSRLMRSQVPKDAAAGPLGVAPNWVPVLENILNDPGNPADAIFIYPCPGGLCPAAKDLQQVQIKLRVQSFRPDPQTHQYRQLSVVETAQRMNPTQ